MKAAIPVPIDMEISIEAFITAIEKVSHDPRVSNKRDGFWEPKNDEECREDKKELFSRISKVVSKKIPIMLRYYQMDRPALVNYYTNSIYKILAEGIEGVHSEF